MQYIARIFGTSDINLFLYVNQRMQCKILDKFMPCCTFLGGAYFTVLISLFLMLFGKGEIRFVAAKGSIALAVSFTIGFLLKKLLGRPRPFMVIPNAHVGDRVWKDYSFPSGHTAAGFSLAVNYALFYPQLAIPLTLCAVLVGISRVYLGYHYPTDILAGAVLGTLTAAVVYIC